MLPGIQKVNMNQGYFCGVFPSSGKVFFILNWIPIAPWAVLKKKKLKMKQGRFQAALSNRGEDTIRKEAVCVGGAGPWVPRGCTGHESGQGHWRFMLNIQKVASWSTMGSHQDSPSRRSEKQSEPPAEFLQFFQMSFR